MATKKKGKTAPIDGQEGADANDGQENEAQDRKNREQPSELRAGRRSRRPENQDTGDREVKGEEDKTRVWTQESKERWGADQPTLAEQLESQRKIEEQIAEDERETRKSRR